jgi:hypothetical protein
MADDPCAAKAAYRVTYERQYRDQVTIDVCHGHVHDVAGDTPIEVIDLASGQPWEVPDGC